MADEFSEQRQAPAIIKGAQFGLSEQDAESATSTSGSPAEVLARVRQLYDRAVELEAAGTKKRELIGQLRQEFPEVESLYWLLRKQPWGYRLGQAVTAQKTLDEEEAKYGPQSSE